MRISSAGLIQENGWQDPFQLWQNRPMGSEIVDAGDIAAAKRLPIDDGKNTSTRLGQDAEVGVKCS